MDKFQQTVQDIAALIAEYDNEPYLIMSIDTINLIKGIADIFNKNDIVLGVYKPNGKIESIGVA